MPPLLKSLLTPSFTSICPCFFFSPVDKLFQQPGCWQGTGAPTWRLGSFAVATGDKRAPASQPHKGCPSCLPEPRAAYPQLSCMPCCFGFSCRRQQKCHAAAPPPAAVRRRMERNRQKLVGRDKGSLTEQQTKGNRNNNDTDKEKTRHELHEPQSGSPEQDLRRFAPEPRVSSRRAAPPHQNPA